MQSSSIKVLTTAFMAFAFSLAITGCVTQSDASNATKGQPMKSAVVMTGEPEKVAMLGERFAWHPSVAKVVAHEQLDQDKVILRSQEVIAELLQSKGYQLVSYNNAPDFLVGFGVALESGMSDDAILAKAGLVAGLPSVEQTNHSDVSTKEKGSLYIGFFPSEHKRSVWRILAQGYADFSVDVESKKARHQTLLAQMLSALPQAK